MKRFREQYNVDQDRKKRLESSVLLTKTEKTFRKRSIADQDSEYASRAVLHRSRQRSDLESSVMLTNTANRLREQSNIDPVRNLITQQCNIDENNEKG